MPAAASRYVLLEISGAAPLYAVTPTSSKMNAASRKLFSLANGSNVWPALISPAAMAAAVKLSFRLMSGWATAAEPSAVRRNFTWASSSPAISWANCLTRST